MPLAGTCSHSRHTSILTLCDVLAAVERVIETFRTDEAMVMHCCLVLGNMTEVASFVRWFHTAP